MSERFFYGPTPLGLGDGWLQTAPDDFPPITEEEARSWLEFHATAPEAFEIPTAPLTLELAHWVHTPGHRTHHQLGEGCWQARKLPTGEEESHD